jgi:dihydroflavonol-4-reductase
VNVRGTAHVVDAALETGVERLVHTSSIAALGRPENLDHPINERLVWHHSPLNTSYAVSKHEAELEVYRGLAEGLDAVIVNPSLVFGVGRSGENTYQIAERIARGSFPAIPTGSTNVVDVEDVAAGHVQAMQYGRKGERYLLGGENLSWGTIIDTLAEALGVAPPRRMLTPRLALAAATLSEAAAFITRGRPLLTRAMARSISRGYTYDNRKAVEVLGCSFRPFAATAHRMAEAIHQSGSF